MNIEQLLAKSASGQLQFQEVLDHIAAHYDYHPTTFQNGSLQNSKEENQGSAKLLYFAQLNQLSKEDTLRLFAEHYQNVLDNPTGEGHQNIRQFMANGWDGVAFEQAVLNLK
ncbi:HopJ type III effector protein [Sphingobacterium sp. N143]|uniref:HopJ type III effector protein n=1 Tax=Sphingobacterium sp. N143 TaxID=2746727 RepID=UPI002575A963|nr:HopJ type III effector protein [Sphingobacterium sp. N143]MDM1294651.1 HopJ type III effector protein [Sphingobacterium sp. N143]